MKDYIKKLKELAKEATQGEWENSGELQTHHIAVIDRIEEYENGILIRKYNRHRMPRVVNGDYGSTEDGRKCGGGVLSYKDATYIALACPQKILKLIEYIESIEGNKSK